MSSDKLPVKKKDNEMAQMVGQNGSNLPALAIKSRVEMYKFAEYLVNSGLTPQGIDSPAKAMVVMQAGLDAGLTLTASMNYLYPVKGRVGWYGKAVRGLIFSRGACEEWEQGYEGEGDERYAWIRTIRKGIKGVKETKFSIAQAKSEGLWGSSPNWKSRPDVMIMWRCTSRHADQWFPDVMLGMPIVEVVRDKDWPEKEMLPAPTEDSPDGLLAQAVSDEEIANGEIVEPASGTGDDEEQDAPASEPEPGPEPEPVPPPAAAAPKKSKPKPALKGAPIL